MRNQSFSLVQSNPREFDGVPRHSVFLFFFFLSFLLGTASRCVSIGRRYRFHQRRSDIFYTTIGRQADIAMGRIVDSTIGRHVPESRSRRVAIFLTKKKQKNSQDECLA